MAFIPLIILLVIVVALICSGLYVVKQQTFAIIERLGKYHTIVGPGLHLKIPVIDRIAKRVDMRTHQSDFDITAKTKDNVNIGMHIATQYRVNDSDQQGVYKSYYVLSNPIQQMESYIIDALRSAIPKHTLDEVYYKKDDIAVSVNTSVSDQMLNYGFQVVSTLITGITLPQDVEVSMNSINAAQREKEAAQSLADAEKIKVVTEATANAEAAKQAGIGIAEQRKAIADGIASSLETIQKSGVSTDEANLLFMFSQWNDMMEKFAKHGNCSEVVLPSNFNETYSQFSQYLVANETQENKVMRPPTVDTMDHTTASQKMGR